jgi:hypothetical protein
MDSAELTLEIQATQAFIYADAESIQLSRSVRATDGAGGYVDGAPAPIIEQTARLVPQSDNVPQLVGSDGRLAKPEWVIMFMPGADVARFDRFTRGNSEWEIANLHPAPKYILKGDVIKVGR